MNTIQGFIEEAARTPYIAYNGIELTECTTGYCSAKIEIKEHHKNLHGTMHGGCVFTLADTVAGYTAMSEGTVVTTLSGNINYLHPVKDTKFLYCKGEIIKNGKTIIVVRTTLTDDNGNLLADGSFSCYVLRKR